MNNQLDITSIYPAILTTLAVSSFESIIRILLQRRTRDNSNDPFMISYYRKNEPMLYRGIQIAKNSTYGFLTERPTNYHIFIHYNTLKILIKYRLEHFYKHTNNYFKEASNEN
jgi:hypothetical protein